MIQSLPPVKDVLDHPRKGEWLHRSAGLKEMIFIAGEPGCR